MPFGRRNGSQLGHSRMVRWDRRRSGSNSLGPQVPVGIGTIAGLPVGGRIVADVQAGSRPLGDRLIGQVPEPLISITLTVGTGDERWNGAPGGTRTPGLLVRSIPLLVLRVTEANWS
jgi:hypothetical protein